MIGHLTHMSNVRPKGLDRAAAEWALAEIARLQADNRRWSKIADERGKESNALRLENERLRAADAKRLKLFEARNEEIDRLRLRLKSILEWHQNWDAPFHDDDEWVGDYRLAREELGMIPRAIEQTGDAKMKAFDVIERADKRRLRAQALTHHIMSIVGKYVDEDRERDCMRDLHRELMETLYNQGVEIISDYDRQAVGLPPRGPDGWTMEEVVALEKRRLELMYAPIPPMIIAR